LKERSVAKKFLVLILKIDKPEKCSDLKRKKNNEK